MSYLLDTDVISALERKPVAPRLAAWIKQHESECFIPVVVWAELQYGVNSAPKNAQEKLSDWLAETRQAMAAATEFLDERVLVCWKELLAALKAKNRAMTCEDSLIAATALFHGHTVVTRNKRHFEPAGVAVLDPCQG